MGVVKFIDLFCGIGGFRIAAEKVFDARGYSGRCVLSSDIDRYVQLAYGANFGHSPVGDIKKINAGSVPDHDIMFAGFPCQPFSIIGEGKGFDDIRGTLFFDIVRILSKKRPKAFVLENVKRLVTHDNGRTMRVVLKTLRGLGYFVDYRVLNALDYGLPQKRERVIIIGYFRPIRYLWPEGRPKMVPLNNILERRVDRKYYASEYIRSKRKALHRPQCSPAIWHENKSGNISSYPYSCALRAGASYNYLLVNGERRLTPREMLRLQGFPDWFKIVVPEAQVRKQAGNAVPVNMIEAVLRNLTCFLEEDLRKEEGRDNAIGEFAALAHG